MWQFFKISLFLILASFGLSAQQAENTQPLELPNFIIEGIEKLNIQSGIKQFPEKPMPYTQAELDSINSLEKQQSLLLPIKPLPSKIIETVTKDAFIKGEFGKFNSPALEGGYAFKIGSYDFYTLAGLDLSGGHIDNSEYSRFFAKVNADYITPEKFLIFGGSKTRTALKLGNKNYKLFASPAHESVSASNLALRIDVDGAYSGLQFHTGAGYETLQLSTGTNKAFDNSINGYLKIQSRLAKLIVGGNVELDLRSLRGTSIHYIQTDAFGAYASDELTIKAKVGFQFASNSSEIERGGLLLAGNIEYRFSKQLTIHGEVSGGLEKATFAELFSINPYLSFDAPLDYSYNIAKIRFWTNYHPLEYIGLTTGANFRNVNRLSVYSQNTINGALDTGVFNVEYHDANIAEFFAEVFFTPGKFDILSFNITASHITAGKDGNTAPYIPSLKMSGFYKHIWFEQFGTQIGINYIGERYADLQNTKKIEGYINLYANFDLKLSNGLSFFSRLENLTNSNIYVWDGYKERGLFASIGVMWQF